MLNKLFGSNTRAKLIRQFLFNPEKGFYIRQLARDLDLQVNSVRRELENLEGLGLLSSDMADPKNDRDEGEYCFNGIKSQKKAKKTTASEKPKGTQEKKYFKANQDFPAFEDLKSLIMKSQILHKDRLSKDLLKVCKPKLLVLTGSFVGRPDIGVDVFIVGRISKEKLKPIIKRLEDDLGREVDFTLMEPTEFKYRREIADMFLYSVLEDKKIVVIDEIGIS